MSKVNGAFAWGAGAILFATVGCILVLLLG